MFLWLLRIFVFLSILEDLKHQLLWFKHCTWFHQFLGQIGLVTWLTNNFGQMQWFIIVATHTENRNKIHSCLLEWHLLFFFKHAYLICTSHLVLGRLKTTSLLRPFCVFTVKWKHEDSHVIPLHFNSIQQATADAFIWWSSPLAVTKSKTILEFMLGIKLRSYIKLFFFITMVEIRRTTHYWILKTKYQNK